LFIGHFSEANASVHKKSRDQSYVLGTDQTASDVTGFLNGIPAKILSTLTFLCLFFMVPRNQFALLGIIGVFKFLDWYALLATASLYMVHDNKYFVQGLVIVLLMAYYVRRFEVSEDSPRDE